jgi:arginine repressor
MKQMRQKCILDIINKYDIETQEELMDILQKHGHETTQATISRDIKELKLIKSATEYNTYKYVQTVQDENRIAAKYKSIIKNTVIDADFAGNLVVLKTYPGMAQAAAAAIDNMDFNEIMGTIAGDDTIFIATYSMDHSKLFLEKFRDLRE